MFNKLTGLLSDAVESVFPGITTEHGKAKSDAVISEFSDREELMAEVYKKAYYDLLNIAYSPSEMQERELGRELKTEKDVREFVNDPDEQKKAVEYNLKYFFNDDTYSDITADNVIEFGDGLDHRVRDRVLHPDRGESAQELDTLS